MKGKIENELKRKNIKSLRKIKQGISLIVLIITIIVILILAMAVIQSFSNNNPIEKAKEARNAHNEAALKEAANLAYLEWYSEDVMGNSTKTPEEYIKEALGKQGFPETEIAKIEITDDGINVLKYAPVVPNGFVASGATGETTVSNGFVIYEGTTPVTDANVATAKTTRNQFVWIPVDDISEFKKKKSGDNVTGPIVMEPNEADSSEVAEFDALYESVKKYHGFYIARYELSSDGSNKKSVAGKAPDCGNSWECSGARSMYLAKNATKEKDPVSTLTYGIQWDLTVKFMKSNNKNAELKASTQVYNGPGTEYIPNTGSNPYDVLNNIYDMGSNVQEWVMTYVSGGGRFVKGGGAYSPISFTASLEASDFRDSSGSGWEGYRAALYLK